MAATGFYNSPFYPNNGAGGTVNSFRIEFFTNSSPVNEKGVPVTDVTFDWAYLNDVPITQLINPIVGTIDNNLRTISIGGQSITDNMMFTLSATNGSRLRTAITRLEFFHPIFVGLVYMGTPEESEILAMGKRLTDAATFQQDFVIDDLRTSIAIHNSLPLLTDVRETVFGLSVLSSFNIYHNVPIVTNAGLQEYTVYIWRTIQNTMNLNQPLNFIW